MLLYPCFKFFHPLFSFYSNSFYYIKNSAFVLSYLKEKRLAPLSFLILLVAVFTAQEEIPVGLANKGQIHIVPIFLFEVHDHFHLV